MKWMQGWLGSVGQRLVEEVAFKISSIVCYRDCALFLVSVLYCNDLVENVDGMFSKFADTFEIVGTVGSKNDCPRLQKDSDQLGKVGKGMASGIQLGKVQSDAF